MIIGHDIAVFADDDARTDAHLRLSAYATLPVSIAEEEVEDVTRSLHDLLTSVLRRLDMHHGMYRNLGRPGKVDRLCGGNVGREGSQLGLGIGSKYVSE